jgi:hypothetical protein
MILKLYQNRFSDIDQNDPAEVLPAFAVLMLLAVPLMVEALLTGLVRLCYRRTPTV